MAPMLGGKNTCWGARGYWPHQRFLGECPWLPARVGRVEQRKRERPMLANRWPKLGMFGQSLANIGQIWPSLAKYWLMFATGWPK